MAGERRGTSAPEDVVLLNIGRRVWRSKGSGEAKETSVHQIIRESRKKSYGKCFQRTLKEATADQWPRFGPWYLQLCRPNLSEWSRADFGPKRSVRSQASVACGDVLIPAAC